MFETEKQLAEENFSAEFDLYETLKNPAHFLQIDVSTDAQVLSDCGMDKATYIKYMECIWYPLLMSKTTVYVKTDGTETMARALLYLIYTALPYSVRPRVTASQSSKNAMFVFCKNPPLGLKYVDPVTGENNILSRSYERRLEENEFALYYVKNFPQSPEDVKAYYEIIEIYLDHMGDKRQSGISALRAAFNMMTRNCDRSNEELIGLLYDWLTLDVPINDHIIANYCEVLKMISERCESDEDVVLEIPEAMENMLLEKIAKVNSNAFEISYYNYIMALLSAHQDNEKEIFRILQRQSKHPLFESLCIFLRNSSNGKRLLSQYFAKLMQDSNLNTYDEIASFYHSFPYSDAHMREILLHKCEDIALNDIKKGIEFEQLKGNYIRTVGSIGVTGCSIKKLCDEFHKMFMQSVTFDPKRMKEYRDFYQNYPDYPQANQILNAIALYREKFMNPAEDEEYRAFAEYMNNDKKITTLAQVEIILKYLIHKEANKLCRSVYLWFSLAKAANRNVFAFAVENEIALFTDASIMKYSMRTNPVWKEKIFLALLERFDEYEKLNKNKLSSEMKKVKGLLRDEYDRQKQVIEAEKKRLAKERSEQKKFAGKAKAEEEAKAKALEKEQCKEAEKRAKEAAKLAKKQGKNLNQGYDAVNMNEPRPYMPPPFGHWQPPPRPVQTQQTDEKKSKYKTPEEDRARDIYAPMSTKKNRKWFDDGFLKDDGDEVGLTSNKQSSEAQIYSNGANELNDFFGENPSSGKSKKWGRK